MNIQINKELTIIFYVLLYFHFVSWSESKNSKQQMRIRNIYVVLVFCDVHMASSCLYLERAITNSPVAWSEQRPGNSSSSSLSSSSSSSTSSSSSSIAQLVRALMTECWMCSLYKGNMMKSLTSSSSSSSLTFKSHTGAEDMSPVSSWTSLLLFLICWSLLISFSGSLDNYLY